MSIYECIMCILLAIFLSVVMPISIIYLICNWRRLIWENKKKRIFRIRRDGKEWIVEKKFLCYFVKRTSSNYDSFPSKESALEWLFEYIKELDEEQSSYILNCTNIFPHPKQADRKVKS